MVSLFQILEAEGSARIAMNSCLWIRFWMRIVYTQRVKKKTPETQSCEDVEGGLRGRETAGSRELEGVEPLLEAHELAGKEYTWPASVH